MLLLGISEVKLTTSKTVAQILQYDDLPGYYNLHISQTEHFPHPTPPPSQGKKEKIYGVALFLVGKSCRECRGVREEEHIRQCQLLIYMPKFELRTKID